ncbi:unnamed protein product [Gordionus sp. m RMFG-2023]
MALIFQHGFAKSMYDQNNGKNFLDVDATKQEMKLIPPFYKIYINKVNKPSVTNEMDMDDGINNKVTRYNKRLLQNNHEYPMENRFNFRRKMKIEYLFPNIEDFNNQLEFQNYHPTLEGILGGYQSIDYNSNKFIDNNSYGYLSDYDKDFLYAKRFLAGSYGDRNNWKRYIKRIPENSLNDKQNLWSFMSPVNTIMDLGQLPIDSSNIHNDRNDNRVKGT